MNSTADTEDDSMNPRLRVILWSALRCMSSVFERSIRELKSVKVVYEPHQLAYHYGPEKAKDITDPALSEIDLATANFQSADETLLQPYHDAGYTALFAKNHAYTVEGRYQHYTEGRFAQFKHTFLIRHPRKSIPSFVKMYEQSGFPLTPDKNGLKQLHDLFKIVQQSIDPNPIVIDADDLLMNPRYIMEHYCSAVGLPFEESMLTWTPGVVKDWTVNAPYYRQEWHGTAMMSSGFMKPKETQPEVKLSEEVEVAIKTALPFYDYMHGYRMKPGHTI